MTKCHYFTPWIISPYSVNTSFLHLSKNHYFWHFYPDLSFCHFLHFPHFPTFYGNDQNRLFSTLPQNNRFWKPCVFNTPFSTLPQKWSFFPDLPKWPRSPKTPKWPKLGYTQKCPKCPKMAKYPKLGFWEKRVKIALFAITTYGHPRNAWCKKNFGINTWEFFYIFL